MNKSLLKVVPAADQQNPPAAESYASLISFLRRRLPLILAIATLCVVAGAFYLLNAPASYTAQASMILDTHKASIFQQQSVIGELPIDAAMVESQVEILRSENIALSVITTLRLTEDPEFTARGGGLIGNIVGFFTTLVGSDSVKSEFELRRRATRSFADRLSIRRVGLTYIIDVSFRANDPARAAQIANAVVDAYVVDQLDAKYKATQRASTWLQDRIRELREQSSAAERAVVDFKTKNNIINTGGRLMNEQLLSELNTQLTLMQAHVADSRARLDRIQEIIAAEIPDATVTDMLKSEVITKLRQQYLDLKAKEADWSLRYGSTHLAAVNLRNQMAQIRESISDELGRIAETYKSEYDIAKQREAALQRRLSQAVTESQATSQAQVMLHELESTAQTAKTLYDNFLQRYLESVQQQTFPVTEARLITPATPPFTKSHPKTLLIICFSGVLGLALGVGTARILDLSDRVFRTGAQIEAILHTPCIGIVPILSNQSNVSLTTKTAAFRQVGTKIITRRKEDLFWQVVDAPFSRSAEAIRALKVAADITGGKKSNKVLGITSALPNEGKSTIAACLAEVMAQGGARVALVDADLRNPSLTRRLTPDADIGLIELCAGTASLADIVWTDPDTQLKFIPAVLQTRVAHTHEILASDATKAVFDKLREQFDYVVVDLSPLAPVVDVRTTTHLIDSFVFVVEWGHTRIDVAKHALQEAPGVYENLVGVVLNKANIRVLHRYEDYKQGYYYNKFYARYGYTD